MRYRSVFAALFPLALAASVSRAQTTSPSPYAATLARAAALSPAELVTERTNFLAWLDRNRQSLSGNQLQGVQEHLYFLIGSAAQAQFRATNRLSPARDTLGLAELFDQGTRLGLMGAGLVAHALAGSASTGLKPAVMPDKPFQLTFDDPLYTLRSTRGWAIRFPFYYMIGGMQVGTPNNGVETETVVLSTLFAEHRGQPGRSQATLLILAATPSDTSKFYTYWLDLFKLREADRVAESPVPASRLYRGFDAALSMNKEVFLVSRGGTAFVFAYTGLPGTFESNRADVLAVVGSFTTDTAR